ncbi:MAG: hypothetical protein AVO38_05120 [delta proteobacterium ML8_D]|nr:MAG: hypothetical protein AVO38_05120 [delta proteobacterium ML8_D]
METTTDVSLCSQPKGDEQKQKCIGRIVLLTPFRRNSFDSAISIYTESCPGVLRQYQHSKF